MPALTPTVPRSYEMRAATQQFPGGAEPTFRTFGDIVVRSDVADRGSTAVGGQGYAFRDSLNCLRISPVRMLLAPERGGAWKADESREHDAGACVAQMHRLLRESRAGHVHLLERALQPGDLAVLVRTHEEGALVQRQLAQAGIPAVAAGRQSLFASDEALEVLALLEALLHPGDEARLRGALATMLLGFDATQIAALDDDDAQRGQWQLRALAWRERWERHGPLALVSDRCADNAPRLLQLLDGERPLTNLLQLGEALQEAHARALGLHGLVDWLRRRIAEADDYDETQQLRLESDAQRVQVMTLHKSKGLEFPLVFLPFAGIGKEPKPGRSLQLPGADGRVLHLRSNVAEHVPAWQEAVAAWEREERAEDARLLYVGLTRAQHAGKANASDFIKLMDLTSQRVKKKFGIILEPEIRIFGREIAD